MGDMFKAIDDYMEMLCKELHRIVDEKNLSPQNLEIVNLMAETCKDFEKFRMMKYAEENQDDYRGSYYRDGYNGSDNYNKYPNYMYEGNDGDHHTPGENYNRGYNSSRNYGGYGTYNNSRNYGHTPKEIADNTIKELERLINNVQDSQSREQIRNHIEQLKSQNR